MPTFTLTRTDFVRTYEVTDAPLVQSEVTRWQIRPTRVEVQRQAGVWSVWIRGWAVDVDGTEPGQWEGEDFYGDSIPEWVRPLLTEVA